MVDFESQVLVLLILSVLASGCVSINVNQEIHRDSSSDISMSIDSQSPLVLNITEAIFKQNLAVENAEVSKNNTSISYSFEDVYPQEQEEKYVAFLATSNNGSGEEATDFDYDYEKDSGLMYTNFRIEVDSVGNLTNLSGGEGNDDTQDSVETIDLQTYLKGPVGRALNSSFEFDYDIETFGTVVDTNGEKLEDGSVRFDLTKNKDYYVEFKAPTLELLLDNFGDKGPRKPEWNISQWNECTAEGNQNRSVDVVNDVNYMFKPFHLRECEYVTKNHPREMVLNESEAEGYEAALEKELEGVLIAEGYRREFKKNNGVIFKHSAIKPSVSIGKFLKAEKDNLRLRDYEETPEIIVEGDNTTAYSKTVGTKTVSQSSNGFEFEDEVEVLRKVVYVQKHDILHKFVLKGESDFGLRINGVENFDSIAEKAMSKTV